jgi:CheY-like chemotaxis protein
MPQPLILISDDDTSVLVGLSRAAARHGLTALVDYDGRVLDLAREKQPAVILLDLHQGALDGRNALARLRADPTTRDIEVIVMSGKADTRTRTECLVLGATCFEPKPFRPELMKDVAALVRQVLRRESAAWSTYRSQDLRRPTPTEARSGRGPTQDRGTSPRAARQRAD